MSRRLAVGWLPESTEAPSAVAPAIGVDAASPGRGVDRWRSAVGHLLGRSING